MPGLVLPYDVLERIVEVIQQDRLSSVTTLKSLSLTNHTLFTVCQPLVFRQIQLYFRKRESNVDSFVQLFTNRPHLRRYVREITFFAAGAMEFNQATTLSHLLRQFDDIRRVLCDIKITWAKLPIEFRELLFWLFEYPSVTSVHITSGFGWPEATLARFRHVQVLELGYLYLASQPEGPDDGPFDLPSLRRLSLCPPDLPSLAATKRIVQGASGLTHLHYELRYTLDAQSPSYIDGLAALIASKATLKELHISTHGPLFLRYRSDNLPGISDELLKITEMTNETMDLRLTLYITHRHAADIPASPGHARAWCRIDETLAHIRKIQPSRRIHFRLGVEFLTVFGPTPLVWEQHSLLPQFRETMGDSLQASVIQSDHRSLILSTFT